MNIEAALVLFCLPFCMFITFGVDKHFKKEENIRIIEYCTNTNGVLDTSKPTFECEEKR